MLDPEWDSDCTRELLERIDEGEQSAIEELLARDRELIRRMITLRLDPEASPRLDVSDVIQETQLQITCRLRDYLHRRPMPYRVWVRRTTIETILQLRRKLIAARRNPRLERLLPLQSSLLIANQLIDPNPQPLQILLEIEQKEQIHEAITQLSLTDQEVLLMRTVEGLTNQEVSQILNLDPATASKRFGRALLNLRQLVQHIKDSSDS